MLVTCAIIIQDKKVLVTQRPFHKSQGGKWEFPGGKVQENESPEGCLTREILEELDVDIEVQAKLQPIHYNYPTFSIELLPFLCVIRNGSLQLHEHIAFKWLPLDELSEMDLCEADKKILPLLPIP